MRTVLLLCFLAVVGCHGTPAVVDAASDVPGLVDNSSSLDTGPTDAMDMTPPIDAVPVDVPADDGTVDTPPACDATTCTDHSCVDTQSDPQNCGACYAACPSGAPCVSGVCVCPSGGIACNTQCVDPRNDPLNCGGCSLRCSSTQICVASLCECATGLTACGSACADLQRDDLHCGSCTHPCGVGTLCRGGACVPCTGSTVSFSADVQPIFAASCALAGCHTGAMPAEGLDLSAGAAYGSTVGVPASLCVGEPRIAAGDTSNSELMFAVTGIGRCPVPRMPQTGAHLSSAEIDTLRAWICAGATHN